MDRTLAHVDRTGEPQRFVEPPTVYNVGKPNR